MLVIPLGATEQHGPHLPLETDTLIARAIAHRQSRRATTWRSPPALPYGSSGEHGGFPGTLSLGQDTLELRWSSSSAARRLRRGRVASWHGGNAEPLSRAVARLRAEGHRVVAGSPPPGAADLHAGRTETSLMLALAPERVRDARRRRGAAPPRGRAARRCRRATRARTTARRSGPRCGRARPRGASRASWPSDRVPGKPACSPLDPYGSAGATATSSRVGHRPPRPPPRRSACPSPAAGAARAARSPPSGTMSTSGPRPLQVRPRGRADLTGQP